MTVEHIQSMVFGRRPHLVPKALLQQYAAQAALCALVARFALHHSLTIRDLEN